mgnify:CR=1 FL=1
MIRVGSIDHIGYSQKGRKRLVVSEEMEGKVKEKVNGETCEADSGSSNPHHFQEFKQSDMNFVTRDHESIL